MTQPVNAPGPDDSGPATPAVPGNAYRRALLAWRNAVFALFFVSGLSLATWFSRVPAIRDGLELDTAQVGIIIFGLSGGSMLGLLNAAWLLARLGARRAMLLGMIITAAGMVAVGVGSSLLLSAPFVFAGLVLVGIGLGAVDVIMNVEGAAVERAIGKALMPLMHACFSLGTIVGALLGSATYLLNMSVFWHLAPISLVVLGTAIVAVRSVPLLPELRDDASLSHLAESPAPWRARLRGNLTVWKDRKLLPIGVIVLGMTFAEGSANDWMAIAAVDGHGFSNAAGAIVFGVFVAAMTIGRVLGGPVLDRFGRVPVLRASSALGIVGLILFILAPDTGFVYAGAVLWGLGASLGFPVGMSAAADEPRNAAARVSAVAMIGYFAFLVGPPALGLLGEAVGIQNALFVIVVLMALAGLASPAARERGKAPGPAANVD